MRRTWRDSRLFGIALGLNLILFATPCLAAGLGVQGSYAYGAQDIDFELVHGKFDNDRFGVGIVFDTSVARDRLINYRVEVVYVRTINDKQDVSNGASINQALGFGLLRNAGVRVWAGPAFRVSVDFYQSEANDVFDLSWGIGPQLGANWHTSNRVSLAASIAYQYQFVRETVRDSIDTRVFRGSEHYLGVSISIFLRSRNDVY